MNALNVSYNARARLRAALFLTLIAVVALGTGMAQAEPAPATSPIPVTVYKTPNCGCCTLWAEHLQDNGFDVDVKMVSETGSLRAQLGIPERLASCHTAVVGDYWVEGHVPADQVTRLLEEHPVHIRGIAAPGMPLGSPGMEAPGATSFEVVSFDDRGRVELYETVQGRTER